jgi:peptidoglycan/xylan/chitin deacetylase (PgdA/CDA1 family)
VAPRTDAEALGATPRAAAVAGVGEAPRLETVPGPFGYALSIDVEEWYHTCLEPDFVDPARRPPLPSELDRLLPELLELLWRSGARATFFVLGEVARQLPGRIREIAMAGHEVASHGDLHLRVGGLQAGSFRRDVGASKALLEDLVGQEVTGYRAPEWSLRRIDNPRLRLLAECGYLYDSSLAPWPGAGSRRNPVRVTRLRWQGGGELLEVPPLAWGGRLRLPGSGWPARLATPEVIAEAARRSVRDGGLPVVVAHPWELSTAPTPGVLTGLARLVHELGRAGYRERFRHLLDGVPWRPMREALAGGRRRPAEAARPQELSAATVLRGRP